MNNIRDYLEQTDDASLIKKQYQTTLLLNLCVNYNGHIIAVSANNLALLSIVKYVLDKNGYPVIITDELKTLLIDTFNSNCDSLIK